jgi:hypothetical protein
VPSVAKLLQDIIEEKNIALERSFNKAKEIVIEMVDVRINVQYELHPAIKMFHLWG